MVTRPIAQYYLLSFEKNARESDKQNVRIQCSHDPWLMTTNHMERSHPKAKQTTEGYADVPNQQYVIGNTTARRLR